MRLLTGDAGGLVKAVHFEEELIAKWGEQARAAEVQGLCWSGPGARGDASRESSFSALHRYVSPPRTLSWRGPGHARGGEVCSSGVIRTWDPATQAEGVRVEAWAPAEVGSRSGLFLASLGAGRFAFATKEGVARVVGGGESAEWKVSDLANVECGGVDGGGRWMCVAGKELLPALYDVEGGRKEASWTAKNVKHDFLDMRVPVWDQGLCFLGGGGEGGGAGGGAAYPLFATCSRHRHVRVYDARADRRAVASEEVGKEFALFSMCSNADGSVLYVGDATGHVSALDRRMSLRLLGKLRSATGTITALEHHASLPLLAATSLDRCVRVWETKKEHALQHRVYLRQQLLRLTFSCEGRKAASASASAAADGASAAARDDWGEDEALWGDLEAREAREGREGLRGDDEDGDEEDGDELDGEEDGDDEDGDDEDGDDEDGDDEDGEEEDDEEENDDDDDDDDDDDEEEDDDNVEEAPQSKRAKKAAPPPSRPSQEDDDDDFGVSDFEEEDEDDDDEDDDEEEEDEDEEAAKAFVDAKTLNSTRRATDRTKKFIGKEERKRTLLQRTAERGAVSKPGAGVRKGPQKKAAGTKRGRK